MTEPIPLSEYSVDHVPEHTGVIDARWLDEHLNMSIALRAYEKGVADPEMGHTNTSVHKSHEKLALIDSKVTIQHTDDAVFPMTDDEIKETLCLFPESWLRHAMLKTVTVRPPAHFVTKKYGDHHFIAGIEEIRDGKKCFNGEEVDDGFYKSKGLTAPGSIFHYAPGQYMGSNEDILLFQEPTEVQKSITHEALRQYGRELIVHEFLHSVLRKDANLVFMMNGVPWNYELVLREFYDICQRERASVSEYSELYSPLLSRPFDLKDEWIKMALQEELGELLSSTLLGWGATPKGEAKKISERDFGGTTFKSAGKSEKLAFAENLLAATVTKEEVDAICQETMAFINQTTDK